MTAVLDPDVLTGFHDGPVYYSAEDGRFYLLTDDGAIPADGPRYATTLNAAQLSMCGADHFTLRSDGTVDMMRPASPYTAAYEDTIMGMHFPGGLGLMGASGSSSLRKRLALNFLSGGSLDPRITFTRASSATRVNSSGLIETVSSNVARIDYDPVTLLPKGLLIEEQRTNLVINNEGQVGGWTPNAGVTVTSAYSNPLTGAANGRLFSGASTTTWSSPNNVSQALTGLTSSSAYAGSMWFVPVTATSVTISLRDAGSGAYATTTQACTPGVPVRLATTLTLGASTTALSMLVAGNGDFIGYGEQLELGSFATSTIKTAGSSVTRAADVASITGTNFSDWYNQSTGTFVVEGSSNGINSGTGQATLFSVHDGTTSNRMRGRYGSLISPSFEGANGGVPTWDVIDTGTSGATNKLSCAYASNDIAISLNGAAVSADASATIPTVDRLTIGGFLTARELNGHIRRLSYYPTRLSNAQLQALTA